MGMLDSELVFASAQTPTVVGDTPSTNSYDTGSATGNSAGAEASMTGENLYVNVICKTAPASAGAATIQGVLQSAPDNATWTDAIVGPALGYAAVAAGTPLLQVPPPEGTQRYWRVVFRIAGAVLTAGAFDAYISNTIQRNKAYPSGFSVS